jgi:acyl carrier protein
MAHLDLITRTEKAFGLEISGHQAMEIKTLNDLMNIVEEKMTVS